MYQVEELQVKLFSIFCIIISIKLLFSASEDLRSNCTMEEDFQCLKEENSLLRNEMQMLKTRNNRLIDQLREKSVMLSRLQDHTSGIEEQVSYNDNKIFNIFIFS